MGGVPVATSELVGTFLETLGFGIYLMVTPEVLRVTIRKKFDTFLRWYFLGTVVLIFIFASLHLVVDLTRAFEAFTSKMDTPDAPEAYFANVNTALNLTKNAAYTSATIVADMLLVYRTFVVWGRNWWIIIVPTLILIVDFAMSVWFTWSVNEARPGSSVLVSTVFQRSKYFLIATLILNVLCTSLISFRIWRIQSQVELFKSTGRRANAISIIVESAAIYSAVMVVLIVCSVTGVSPFFFFLNSMPPLIGVVFSYIILRSTADDRRTFDNTTFTTTLKGSGRMIMSKQQRQQHQQTSTVPRSDGVHIHLQQIVHQDEIDLEQQSESDKSAPHDRKSVGVAE